jgi:Ran GTPase-activating protein (RanGAP) involved in mRNA processing and transport
MWMASLRGREAMQDLIGLKEFILKNNKLSQETIKALSAVIAENETIRVIDMRENQISEKVLLNELYPNLKVNLKVTNFDLRGNPGYTEKVN